MAHANTGNNFGFVAKEKSLVVLPAGFVYIFFRPVPVVAVRWSFVPGWKDENRRILRSVCQTLEAIPALKQTKYPEWAVVMQEVVNNEGA